MVPSKYGFVSLTRNIWQYMNLIAEYDPEYGWACYYSGAQDTIQFHGSFEEAYLALTND